MTTKNGRFRSGCFGLEPCCEKMEEALTGEMIKQEYYDAPFGYRVWSEFGGYNILHECSYCPFCGAKLEKV